MKIISTYSKYKLGEFSIAYQWGSWVIINKDKVLRIDESSDIARRDRVFHRYFINNSIISMVILDVKSINKKFSLATLVDENTHKIFEVENEWTEPELKIKNGLIVNYIGAIKLSYIISNGDLIEISKNSNSHKLDENIDNELGIQIDLGTAKYKFREVQI